MVEISVILVAHDRKIYIIKALDSVYRQTLKSEEYEVIVVKNFADEYLDRYISILGFKNIITPKQELAAKLDAGFKASTGKIITVLEDDDLYESRRLEVIHNEFFRNSIVFYHNNYWIIDEEGLLINENRQKKSLFFNIDDMTGCFRKAIYFRGHHNLSSMAFERAFFALVIKNFYGITYAVDVLFFLEALSSEGNLFLDSRKLTFYMQHESASTSYQVDESDGRQNSIRDSDTLDLMQRLLNKELNPLLKDRIRLLIIEKMIYINLKSGPDNARPKVTFRQLYLFIREKLHYPEPEAYFVILLFLASKLFPTITRNTLIKIARFRVGRGI